MWGADVQVPGQPSEIDLMLGKIDEGPPGNALLIQRNGREYVLSHRETFEGRQAHASAPPPRRRPTRGERKRRQRERAYQQQRFAPRRARSVR